MVHSDITQAKTIVWHPVDFADYIQQVMGVLNYNEDYDQFFSKAKNAISILEEIQEAIKQGVINLKGSSISGLDETAFNHVLKIWRGRCYLVVNRANDDNIIRTFVYERPQEKPFLEIIPLPSLQNMIPVGNIDQETWGIQIRESIPLKYAFDGCEYASIVNEGGFMHKLSDGSFPKFQRDEMESLTKQTYVVSRPYFNTIMDIEKKFFYKNWNVLKINIHRILQHMKLGGFKQETKQKRSFVGKSEN